MSAIAARWISVIGGSTLLIVGTIGSLFNIAVFSHRSLRNCSYSWYILVAAFFDLITLDHPLLLRILSDGFGLDLVSMNNIYCKLRFYTGQISSFVPITLICLAAIDRWAVSDE
jgi:maltodextrin utilization protein YvdJ